MSIFKTRQNVGEVLGREGYDLPDLKHVFIALNHVL